MRAEWNARADRAWVLCIVTTLSACAIGKAHAQSSIAITDVAIVDVEQGRALAPRTVLITDGDIVAIGPARDVPVPPDGKRVDGHGRFLIPGLVDMHVHLFNNSSHRPPNTWSFPLYVVNGVTGVREMAALPDSMAAVKEWRAAQANGTLVALRILSAGVMVDGNSPAQ